MRKSPFLCFAIAILASCSGPRADLPVKTGYELPDFEEFMPRKVALMPIEVNLTSECLLSYERSGTTRPSDEEIASVFYPITYRALEERRYRLLGLAEMESVLEEHGLRSTTQIHEAPPPKLGKILGVDALVYLAVKDITNMDQIQFDVRMVETRHGLILWTDRYFKTGKGGFRGALSGSVKGVLIVAGYAAAPLTMGQSPGLGSALGEKLGTTLYKTLTSVEKEIELAVDDCLKGLPRCRS